MVWCLARGRRAGFTLIEIMIVIAIIAILAAVAIPNIQRARAEGQFAACGENCKVIATAIAAATTRMSDIDLIVKCGRMSSPDQHHFSMGRSLVEYLVENGYLKSEPLCPIEGGYYYIDYSTQLVADGDYYALYNVVGDVIPWSGWDIECPGAHEFYDGEHKVVFPAYINGSVQMVR